MQSIALSFNTEVRKALDSNQPIVALESTIITHGMPFPENQETALAVEQAVREAGAVPATIAIIEGRVVVGLTQQQLDGFAQSKGAMKLSRSDLAMAVAKGVNGSTTVAATMIIARCAGIDVFATGGIGGVHRGAELSFDVSADLQELSRTDVAVVCAGAKAILDLPKTLEVLETLGVPVLAYQQNNLPAFWSRDSQLQAPLRADSVSEIIDFINARKSLDLSGGVLICNPAPKEHEIPGDVMSAHVQTAIEHASAEKITGKALTPWLLNRILELTDGKSLQTNQALIINNARLAAELAISLNRMV